MLSCDINSPYFGQFLATIANENQRLHNERMAQIKAGNCPPPWKCPEAPKLNRKQVGVRSFYFAQSVADYFKAFGSYPKYDEMRVFFLYATRKARFA